MTPTTLADPDDANLTKLAEEYDAGQAKAHTACSNLVDSLQSTIRWQVALLGYMLGVATPFAVLAFVK